METTNYLIFGSVVVFGIAGLHLASFVVRSNNLQSDLALLEQVRKKPAAKKATKKKRK